MQPAKRGKVMYWFIICKAIFGICCFTHCNHGLKSDRCRTDVCFTRLWHFNTDLLLNYCQWNLTLFHISYHAFNLKSLSLSLSLAISISPLRWHHTVRGLAPKQDRTPSRTNHFLCVTVTHHYSHHTMNYTANHCVAHNWTDTHGTACTILLTHTHRLGS